MTIKRITTLFIGLTTLLAAAFITVMWPRDHVPRALPEFPSQTAAGGLALIKHGEYLARAGDCIACHTVRGGIPLTGGVAMRNAFGVMYTPNITSDPKFGIGKWSADDFYRLMHTGRGRNGMPVYPGFPFTNYTKVTRADSDAIFAYLQSVKPEQVESKPHELRFPMNQRALLFGWNLLFFKQGEFQGQPKKSVEWNRGAYLIEGLGHCGMCHTTMNAIGVSKTSAALSGGLIPLQNWYAPSLTSDQDSGLGSWDEQDIVDLLKTGVSKRSAVFGPMAEVVHDSLQYLSGADVRSMATYLKSLPSRKAPSPIQLETSKEFAATLLTQGGKVYGQHCASCHRDNGLGMPTAYPPLANNQAVQMKSAVNPIRMVLNGGYPPSTTGNPQPYGMPPFAQSLSDQEVAAVVTFVRQSWGNSGAAVSPQQVATLRSSAE